MTQLAIHLEDGKLVDLAELLEHGPQVVVLEVPGDLADEQLDGVRILLALDALWRRRHLLTGKDTV